MLNSLFPWIVAGACFLVAFIWLRFGEKFATIAGAILAALLVWLKLRDGVKQEVENDQLKERVKNDEARNENERRAEDAADRVRVQPVDELRQSDPFERR
jgi:uncharacterized membrane protein YhiD involved in acid resistance